MTKPNFRKAPGGSRLPVLWRDIWWTVEVKFRRGIPTRVLIGCCAHGLRRERGVHAASPCQLSGVRSGVKSALRGRRSLRRLPRWLVSRVPSNWRSGHAPRTTVKPPGAQLQSLRSFAALPLGALPANLRVRHFFDSTQSNSL